MMQVSEQSEQIINITELLNLQSVKEVVKYCCDKVSPICNNDKFIFAFKLCLYELISNAVEHGNKEDPSKYVRIYVALLRDSIIIKVEDEGQGFNWRSLKQTYTSLDALRGRGLKIIQHYCTAIAFNEKGNVVQVIISFTNPPQ